MLMCDQGYLYPDLQEALECLTLTAHVWGVRMTSSGGFDFTLSEHKGGPRSLFSLERLDVLSLEEPPPRPAPLAPLWGRGHVNLKALRGCVC